MGKFFEFEEEDDDDSNEEEEEVPGKGRPGRRKQSTSRHLRSVLLLLLSSDRCRLIEKGLGEGIPPVAVVADASGGAGVPVAVVVAVVAATEERGLLDLETAIIRCN